MFENEACIFPINSNNILQFLLYNVQYKSIEKYKLNEACSGFIEKN